MTSAGENHAGGPITHRCGFRLACTRPPVDRRAPEGQPGLLLYIRKHAAVSASALVVICVVFLFLKPQKLPLLTEGACCMQNVCEVPLQLPLEELGRKPH